MKTGLFFGSFNPIHKGHLDIAKYMTEHTDLDKIWFIVTPQNPLKGKDVLLDDFQRLKMVQLAVEESISASIDLEHADIEFNLSRPSYTLNTLTHIKAKYPNDEFVLIIGSDNLAHLDKWKNYEQILENYEIYVYPRPESDGCQLKSHHKVKMVGAPLIDNSSDHIRSLIIQDKDVSDLLPETVNNYIKENGFYKKK